MRAQVFVKLKSGVLDPQGMAIHKSLSALGFDGVDSVRQGKVFDIDLAVDSTEAAKDLLNQISEKLLANTVIEDFEVKLL